MAEITPAENPNSDSLFGISVVGKMFAGRFACLGWDPQLEVPGRWIFMVLEAV